MSQTKKNNYVKGWKNEKPSVHERTIMKKRCGKKCFLGSKKSFPICKKHTCKISSKGIYAAYMRSRQFRAKGSKYRSISSKSKKMLIEMGVKR